MTRLPALPGGPPAPRPRAIAQHRLRFSWTAFEAQQREDARRADGRTGSGPATGLPIVQEFVVRHGCHLEGRGENAWIIPDPPTLHRIIRRTRDFVFIEAVPWDPRRWRGWDRPLRTRRLSRARIDAGNSDRFYRLPSADDAPPPRPC